MFSFQIAMQNCSAGKLTRASRVVFHTPRLRARDLAKRGEAQGGRGGRGHAVLCPRQNEKVRPFFFLKFWGPAGDEDTQCFAPDLCNSGPALTLPQHFCLHILLLLTLNFFVRHTTLTISFFNAGLVANDRH